MDAVSALRTATEQTGRIVMAIGHDQFGLPTPCPDWDVRTLMNHTVGSLLMFGAAARQEHMDLGTHGRDVLGDDPGGAYDRAASSLLEAAAVGAIEERQWLMASGPTPASVATGVATIEIQQHGWDLARATGQQVDFDPDVVASAMATAETMLGKHGRGEAFGEPVACPDDAAPHDRLAAFLGRRVSG